MGSKLVRWCGGAVARSFIPYFGLPLSSSHQEKVLHALFTMFRTLQLWATALPLTVSQKQATMNIQGLGQTVPRSKRCKWLAKRGDFVTTRSAGCRFNSHYPQEIHDWMHRDIMKFRHFVLPCGEVLCLAASGQPDSSGLPWHYTIHIVANVLKVMESIT
jgi:hypothetical protein